MSVSIDVAWKSLNKHHEELCGDKVEILKTEDSDIVILADGMGSGVKANILATLTSKILRTMLFEGAAIESCVATIAKTLPICQVRKVAYATFSILQIFRNGDAYLVEYDNPACVFIRDKKIVNYPYEERVIEGKKIHEYRFKVQQNDCFVLMSDGVIYAGAGEILNLQGWTWESMAEYTLQCTKKTMSASRLAALLSQACDDLYVQKPGDDTTVAVARVIERRVVNIFTGPPKSKEDDEKLMHEFMHKEGRKIVCGGTSANIAARILRKDIITKVDYNDPNVPPMATIEGLDLVTEGVLTLGKALKLLKRYVKDEFDVEFFDELDANNGASRLAKILIEECTELNLFVGTAVNEAHQNSELSFDLSVRMNLIEQLESVVSKMGKKVKVNYY
ncbi:serine/threonine-protein phosphatase [Muricomes sp. OA1]|uniref:Serine/threonine-protein phosphatase n=1 Tax=Hungatella hathewayi TaxID=154046 RepID=A0A3E2WC54_9FIRM|nr:MULTISPECIES: SpoIIE family protein phosphatase [Clostridia]MCH1974446.1 serine/threonine-protein phosphatase [Muricomes sp. OA1]MRM91250.1 serine/threonine-protein phosphatase [Faecalicatena contorta]RGC23225.1 serine/threonine-protein phosphatase [Hungatella hathewayi]GKH33223.1 serine/threonine phosphatase [Faecalicatena contorta]